MSDKNASFDLVATLTKAAEAGNEKAQFQLGMMYANADEVSLDYVQAARWMTMSAEQGFSDAQPILAWLYSNGYGVEQSDEKSAYWTRKAAESGVAKSQYALACLYRWGGGEIKIDLKQMIHWYHNAAEQQFAPAQHALGKVMSLGEGVAEDKIGAYQWLSLAILNGSEKAKETLSGLASKMTKAEREQAQQILMKRVHESGVKF